MYAKILIILVLAMLCTGCTDPDLPDLDPDAFENVTPSAPALQKSWNPETQTITISTLDDTPRLTIRKVSAVPDLCTFEEVLEIKSFVDYDLNELKDFRTRWKKHKGQHDISKDEWFILKNESYTAIVNDYETIQVEETHYNNDTEEYYNVTVNQTVLIGNHSEVRYYDIWKPFSPVGKSIHAGQTYTVKIVYHKPPELGVVKIQTIPMFAGLECGELTWWNSSWGYKTDSVVADENFPYQMNLTVHGGSGTNNNTDVFLDGHNNTNFDDIRFTLGDATHLAYWIEDNTTDPVKVWVNVTANGTVNLYYGNPDVNSTSSIDDTFIFGDNFDDASIDTVKWDTANKNGVWNEAAGVLTGSDTDSFWMRSKVAGTDYHIWMYGKASDMDTAHLMGSVSVTTDPWSNGYAFMAVASGNLSIFRAGSQVATETVSLTANTYYYHEIKKVGGSLTYKIYNTSKTLIQTVTYNDGTPLTGDRIAFRGYGQTLTTDWIILGKSTITEPTWGTWGSEQTSSIITAYTPSTPLQKTTGDSQLFTVNTSENSQCRWYINGSLKQTNSTGATRHEYTNTSLDDGYWNFTATANTTDRTSSQTWWVTVSAVGAFEQDMYVDRWMYVAYLDSGNTNLSEFFTDLAPYYLSFYNATDQKTYNYKSGRWEKYADKIIKPGEAAMLRYTSNVTKTRDNASGTFGFTMKTGLNHIGHSYNGSRNLAWYNTTIASANLVTIAHQNPETGTISTFTYGSADNGSVDVLQGCGVEVNVSADTVISGL